MIAIRPPEYLPRLEFCALMLAAERFVLADTFPFSRQSWHNRTKIRTADAQGWQWLTVPRAHGGKSLALNNLALDESTHWTRKHRRAFQVNYAMAPHYDRLGPEIDALLETTYDSLGALTVATVKWLHEKIGGPSELILASELPGQPATLEGIWDAMGDTDGLITLHESAARDRATLRGFAVEVLDFEEHPYDQTFPGFVRGLSAVDMILNVGPV